MIWAFEQKLKDDAEEQFFSGKANLLRLPLDARGEPMGPPISAEEWINVDIETHPYRDAQAWEIVEAPDHTFKIDKEGMDAWEKRVKKGLLFFGKYYSGLWD